MIAHEPQAANHYELESGTIRISYSATSIAGVPILSYQDGQNQRSFRGDEIQKSDSELGTQVTVTLEAVPDLHTVTLTLLLPMVNLRGQAAEVDAVAIRTTHRTSIAGPRLVNGALQSYEPLRLCGQASAIVA